MKNHTEQRILTILDTLNNPYYWQSVMEDIMGAIPPADYYLKYPFRVDLRKYRAELDSLFKEDLSDDFIISLLDTAKVSTINGATSAVLMEKIHRINSPKANAQLYDYVTKVLPYSPLAVIAAKYLTANNAYIDEMKEYLAKSSYNIYLSMYLKLLDTTTDAAILETVTGYMHKMIMDKPNEAYKEVRALETYYDKRFDENSNKYFNDAYYKLDSEKMMAIRNRFYAKSVENALKYYGKHKDKP